MKKIVVIPSLIIFIFGLVYLLLPSPQTPDLSNAVKSDEPGDTYQHPDQKGFYSNRYRAEVLAEMQSKFSLNFLGKILPSYRLNYRPEDTQEFVREQIPTYYLEEIVIPLRESLFVNGWEPKNSPRFANTAQADIPLLDFKGNFYLSKVTLKPVFSSPWSRVLVWILIFPATYLTYISLKRSLKNG